MRGSVLGLALALLGALPAAAECRLALALAFDVSRSVGIRDYAIQKQGVIAALEDPGVVAAFLAPDAPVAFALYEWSHSCSRTMVVDWVLVRSPADLEAIRQTILSHERGRDGGHDRARAALKFGSGPDGGAPPCAEQVIDVSGDGQNNSGVDPALVYAAGFGDIRVNGLAIRSYERDVVGYYREQVIRGPGPSWRLRTVLADFSARDPTQADPRADRADHGRRRDRRRTRGVSAAGAWPPPPATAQAATRRVELPCTMTFTR